MDFPRYELVEIFECSRPCRLKHQKLRFLISDGSCYFIMRPAFINKNSVLLWCYNSSKKKGCKASLLLEFGDEIQTEYDSEAASTYLRRISPGTKMEVLLSKSNYTVASHRVGKKKLFYTDPCCSIRSNVKQIRNSSAQVMAHVVSILIHQNVLFLQM